MRGYMVIAAIPLMLVAIACTTDFEADGETDTSTPDTSTDTIEDSMDDTVVDSGADVPDTAGDTGADSGVDTEVDTITPECETDEDCMDDDMCNGAEWCNHDGGGVCMMGEPLPDGSVVMEEPRMICLDGVMVESVCGDGWLDHPVEACDDGNDVDGDGCSIACRPDHECVITLDGGSPVDITSISVQPDGSMSVVDAASVAGTHQPFEPPTFQSAITACGRNVYAIFEGDAAIQHVDVDLAGVLTPGWMFGYDGIQGLVCDGERSRLLGYAIRPPAEVAVISLDIAPDGSMTLDDEVIYTFGPTSMDTSLANVSMRRHPVTGEIWLVAGWEDWMMGEHGLDGVRIEVDGMGYLTALEGPTTIASSSFFSSIEFHPDGRRLLVPGYSGGCFGWAELGSGGWLPTTADFSSICTGNFGSSKRAAQRMGSDVFYFTRQGLTAFVIARHTLGAGLFEIDSYAASGDDSHIQLLYGDSVLLTLTPAGDLRTFMTSPDGTALTWVSDMSTSGGGFLESSVVLPCTI